MYCLARINSRRSFYIFILCTTMVTVTWFHQGPWFQNVYLYMQSNTELASSTSGENTAILRALHPIMTSLNWTRNRKSIGALKIKEHTEALKPCLSSSEIPKVRIDPRKNKTTLARVNAEIFGSMVRKVRHAAGTANKSLPSILMKRRSIQKAASSIDQTISKMNLAVDVDDYRVLPGGHWIPLSCRPLWKVAIVVGFRNRFQHLPIFLRHIVPLLKRQKLEFSIFISEQRNNLLFNKAMVMNIGFIEAMEFNDFDCVVFHDVDHLAMNVRNYYGCENMPKHFESGEPKWNWKLPYQELFGGAVGVTTSQFVEINGFPNVYWGWGGEDDDFYNRVVANGFKPSRPEGEIGYFDTIEHNSKDSSRLNIAKFCLQKQCAERMSTDGLSNLKYEPPTIELHPLYTNISVNIQRLPWNPKWKRCDTLDTMYSL
ncbi:beta-1,4-galactosyltransferase 5 [Strongylocentrotus purpuratus]|uniref:Beta-1,4-galactosyltransferase n=1 Tax=Strongylocentrotus purpuratus TaxID=7668 RepID=A0A7M7LTX9_STRPU|nr:beta-1,4-galactosyltransferase 5 [Strongylocentrotus purpuratus]